MRVPFLVGLNDGTTILPFLGCRPSSSIHFGSKSFSFSFGSSLHQVQPTKVGDDDSTRDDISRGHPSLRKNNKKKKVKIKKYKTVSKFIFNFNFYKLHQDSGKNEILNIQQETIDKPFIVFFPYRYFQVRYLETVISPDSRQEQQDVT